jgi:RNA 3'-terminal phosphate cyclase (ATP)
MLVLQTVIPPLMVGRGESEVGVTGGTHNPLAPCFEYVRDVFGVLASAAGLQAYFELARAGFYPAGGGEVVMQLRGAGARESLAPLRLPSRGELKRIDALSAASDSLPPHVVPRQAAQATGRLADAGLHAEVEQAAWPSSSPGTVVFLRAVFARSVAGAFALGRRGKPAERVADEAVDALLGFLERDAAVDAHAADQLLVPAALCPRESRFTAERVTSHLLTNAEVVRQLTGRRVAVEGEAGAPGTVTVEAA